MQTTQAAPEQTGVVPLQGVPVVQPVRVPLHCCNTLPEHRFCPTAQVGALHVASAGSQIIPVAQGWSTSVPPLHECRVVELLHTQAESGAHCTHFPAAQMGFAVGHGASPQAPLAEQVLREPDVVEHLGAEPGRQPTQAPFRQAVEVPGTLQVAVAKAPALQ